VNGADPTTKDSASEAGIDPAQTVDDASPNEAPSLVEIPSTRACEASGSPGLAARTSPAPVVAFTEAFVPASFKSSGAAKTVVLGSPGFAANKSIVFPKSTSDALCRS
jgi:hypothetical protein